MKLSELIADEINYSWLDHETLDTSTAIDAIIARLHECDDLPPNAAQRARITELQAQLAKVTAERDEAMREALGLAVALHRTHYRDVPQWKPLDTPAGVISQIDNMVAGIVARAETYRAAIPVAYQMGLEAALPLPRPDGASTWTLDPKFVMDVAHAIQREEGWDTSMEVVELAMLAAERRMLEAKTRHALTTPADLVEQATAKVRND